MKTPTPTGTKFRLVRCDHGNLYVNVDRQSATSTAVRAGEGIHLLTVHLLDFIVLGHTGEGDSRLGHIMG